MLTTCNRLVNKLSQSIGTPPDIGLFVTCLLQGILTDLLQIARFGYVGRELKIDDAVSIFMNKKKLFEILSLY